MLTSTSGHARVTVAHVRFEQNRDALGIGAASPRLTWRSVTTLPGWIQAARQIQLLTANGAVRADTGRVVNDASVLVAWPFAPLAARERAAVRVRVWGADGSESDWSEAAPVEIGLLSPDDWSARFITPDWPEAPAQFHPAPLLHRDFTVKPGLAQARLYVTALGIYEARLNGAVVGDAVLEPGWTSYSHHLAYRTHDVTAQLRPGANTLGAILGDGWYRGRLGFGGGRWNIYGDRLALLAQLELRYADGSVERVVTDDDGAWRATTGPILRDSLYDGETHDARLERHGWDSPSHDVREWQGVTVLERDLGTLRAPVGPPVRRIETLAPVAITQSPSGKTLVDFGQNLVGWLRIRVRGEAGRTVTLRHAEVLENGELGIRPLRKVEATDHYTLSGAGLETWEPRFTFHGFRYAEVSGWPGELRAEDLEAVVVHNDMERTGWFECSNPQINRLHDNVVWSMRDNFLSIPTDCPQRDERLGWTGDIQVFAPTAAFLYDVGGFLQSWLVDLAAEQRDLGGVVPVVIPFMLNWIPDAVAAWGDAATVVPTVLHERLGDVGILATQFDSMRAWVDTVEKQAGPGRLWHWRMQLGDWLDPAAPPHQPAKAQTDAYLVSAAYFARSAELTGRAAKVLGRESEAAHYLALAREVREAFAREYITPNGRLVSDAQTACAVALMFDLLPTATQREHAGNRLDHLVRSNNYCIGTGFVGTPLVCDALTGTGHLASAYGLLTQTACPSWLYPVTMGATTIWERWDSMLPDGSINPGEMTSFNHYALGAIADWLHRVTGGLAPAAPGYKCITIQPRPGGGLTSARARHMTPYGLAECDWSISEGLIAIAVQVPPNTTATVILPGRDDAPLVIGSGTHHWSYPYQALDSRTDYGPDDTIGTLQANPRAWTKFSDALSVLDKDFIFVEIVKRSPKETTIKQAMDGARDPEGLLKGLLAALAAD